MYQLALRWSHVWEVLSGGLHVRDPCLEKHFTVLLMALDGEELIDLRFGFRVLRIGALGF